MDAQRLGDALRIRYERCGARHHAFLNLGCAVICQRLLP
jgi:hypothetical protein